jgi:hypothetical protein
MKKLNVFLEHNIYSGREESAPIHKTTPTINDTYFTPAVLRVREIRSEYVSQYVEMVFMLTCPFTLSIQ